MRTFHCIASVPDWYATTGQSFGLDTSMLERALVAATVIEDHHGQCIACTVQAVRQMRHARLEDGAFAVHIRAQLDQHEGVAMAHIDSDSEIVAGVFDELVEHAPRLVTAAWFEELLRNMRLTHDQEVVAVKEGEGRYEIRINGIRAGLVLGSGKKWSAEWRQTSLGTAHSLADAAMLVQVAWGFF